MSNCINGNDTLMYSIDGIINKMYYLDDNDVFVFAEDQDKEFEYETIIERLLDSTSIKVNDIFTSGGKSNLISIYKKLKEENRLGKCIFISDLDFDYILEKDMINDEQFIYLEKYCIENYFIDEEATIGFIQGRICKKINEVKEQLNFTKWFEEITIGLYKLFLIFIVVQKKEIKISNVAQSAFIFLKNNSWETEESKINEYYNQVSEVIEDIDNEIDIVDGVVKQKTCNEISVVICGKYYFDSLKMYLRKFSRGNIYDKDLRNYLIKNFNINTLDFLKEKIIRLSK